MNKNQEILIEIALMLLFTGIALATSNTLSASSDALCLGTDIALLGAFILWDEREMFKTIFAFRGKHCEI